MKLRNIHGAQKIECLLVPINDLCNNDSGGTLRCRCYTGH